MLSAGQADESKASRERVIASLTSLAFVALAIIAARLPFLLHGSRFFDSDEAVEGLMARHVLNGEFPLYLWGQRYKGVPEVYLAAAAFRAVPGALGSVVGLKAVTLGCFAVYACLNFRLIAAYFSRRVAWIATAFLIAGPPSLVLWSLSASAEIVMTLIAGTSMLLGLDAWRRAGSRAGLTVAAASLGFGLWIQQYIFYYVAAIAVTSIDWTPAGRARIGELLAGRDVPLWLRFATRLLAITACLYIVLGLAAFAGLGFNVVLSDVVVSVTHPQKMWWIAAVLLLVAAAALTAGRLVRRGTWTAWLTPSLGFLAGFAPAIAGRFLAEGYGSPIARMDLAGLRSALSPFGGVALPIVFGFKSPTAERLAVPAWSTIVLAATIVAGFAGWKRTAWARRAGAAGTFHVFLIVGPIMFLASGAFIDGQSYRYLMPLYAALPVVYAVGIDWVTRVNRLAGVALLTVLVALFGLQQADWYRRLQPDREAQTIIDCLDRGGVRAAYADYWLSYKLTFLTGERIIVAPNSGVDRYPPYTAMVRAQPFPPTIEQRPAGAADAACRP
jgi:hypothetical protein